MSIRIGDKVIDECGVMGTVDALSGDIVQIDAYEQMKIPKRHAGVMTARGWFIIAYRHLSGVDNRT